MPAIYNHFMLDNLCVIEMAQNPSVVVTHVQHCGYLDAQIPRIWSDQSTNSVNREIISIPAELFGLHWTIRLTPNYCCSYYANYDLFLHNEENSDRPPVIASKLRTILELSYGNKSKRRIEKITTSFTCNNKSQVALCDGFTMTKDEFSPENNTLKLRLYVWLTLNDGELCLGTSSDNKVAPWIPKRLQNKLTNPSVAQMSCLLFPNESSFLTINCDNQTFKVDRSTICAASPVFNAMLGADSNFSESQSNTIVIEDASVADFKVFLTYLLCNCIELESLEIYAMPLFTLASKYQVQDLIDLTTAQLTNTINKQNFFERLAFSDEQNVLELKKSLVKFAGKHLKELLESGGPDALSAAFLKCVAFHLTGVDYDSFLIESTDNLTGEIKETTNADEGRTVNEEDKKKKKWRRWRNRKSNN